MSPRHVKRNPAGTLCCFSGTTRLLLQIVTTALYYNGYFTNPLINKFLLGQYTGTGMAVLIFDFAFHGALSTVPFIFPFLLLLWSGISALLHRTRMR